MLTNVIVNHDGELITDVGRVTGEYSFACVAVSRGN
jgi:hypothetical protein